MEYKKNRPIGVFDSGIGGLTVLSKLLETCPHEKYLYYGDTKNLPYGEKKKSELIEAVKEIFDFYEQKDVKAVVMACNTSSALVYEELKNQYNFKIYPIIQITSKCVAKMNIPKIGILATRATVESHAYRTALLNENHNLSIFENACPLWVSIVENKLKDYNESDIMKEYLEPVLTINPDKIILGCTHYPHLMKTIKKYAPESIFINPAECFSQYIKEDLLSSGLLAESGTADTEFYVSSDPQGFMKNASLFMKLDRLPLLHSATTVLS